MSDELESARRVLASYAPEAPPGAQRRARLALERQGAPRVWYEPSWAQVAPALTALGVLLLVARWPRTPDAPDASLTATTETGAAPRFVIAQQVMDVPVGKAGHARAARESKLWVPELASDRTVIQLAEGELAVDLRNERAAPIEVQTPEARLRALGARFDVTAVPRETRVGVHEGTVDIQPNTGGAPKRLGPGTRARIVQEAGRTTVPLATAPTQPLPIPEPSNPEAGRTTVPPRPPANPTVTPSSEPPSPGPVPAPATPPPAPPPKLDVLAQARALLPKDPPRAAQLAEGVLEVRPTPAIEAEALALLADAERRRGNRARAAALYARLADHAQGRPYAEEALYQWARIEIDLGDSDQALSILARADHSFAQGPLGPERAGLAAQIHLAAGHVQAAATVLEAAPAQRSILLSRRRLEVAKALLGSDAKRARALLAPLLSDPALSQALRDEARALSR